MSNQEQQLTDVGVEHGDDACKMRRATEHLKMAARLLYEVGSPECIHLGERTDEVIRELIPLIAKEELTTRLGDILRGFARKVVAIVEGARRKTDK